MRVRLGIALALIAIGGIVPQTPTGTGQQPDRPIGFEPPELILDGSEYGRLYPTFADGHHSIVLCDAILQSHREQRWTPVGH